MPGVFYHSVMHGLGFFICFVIHILRAKNSKTRINKAAYQSEKSRLKPRIRSRKSLNYDYLVAVQPSVTLHPGPLYVTEGSDATFPVCYVTGYPDPVVSWRKSSGQLPQGKSHYNNSVLQISDVGKSDSDWYFCSAVNPLGNAEGKTLLVVGSPPVFTVKPPGRVSAVTGDTLTLDCSATGDPQPVISWKRQGAPLPVGRSHRTNDGLTIRDLREEDAGNYTCSATSLGVFHIEAVSHVEIGEARGK